MNLLTGIYSRNNRTQTHRNIYFFWRYFLPDCLFTKSSVRKVKLNAAIFSPAALRTGGGKERGKKGTLEKKKNGCGYQKDSAHLLRFLSEYLKALRKGGGGGPLLALSLPPSLKMNPIEWERWSDAETARNKALTGPKQTPFCVTTNTYLGELTAGNSKRGGPPKCPLVFTPRPHPPRRRELYLPRPACSSSTAGWSREPPRA